jgi:hypothetical protein
MRVAIGAGAESTGGRDDDMKGRRLVGSYGHALERKDDWTYMRTAHIQEVEFTLVPVLGQRNSWELKKTIVRKALRNI